MREPRIDVFGAAMLALHQVRRYPSGNTCFEGLKRIATQAKAGVQERLVVFARSVEILHEPPKARAIKVKERGLNVVPGWRCIFATDHGLESFKDGFMRGHLGWFKIHAF